MSGPLTGVHTVGIRLQGPMQSWANGARGAVRPTHTRPTKAGVVGLIANALGRDYTDPIDDLAYLRFGVRIDEPGTIEVDYHTTGGGGQYYALPTEYTHAPSWWGSRNGDPASPDWMTYAPPRAIAESKTGGLTSKAANPNITNDQYLADASFLAAVEGTDKDLLHKIAAALAAPARALFLGRKAYGPAAPLLEGVTDSSIEDFFAATAGPAIQAATADPTRRGIVDVYIEPRPGQAGTVVADQPTTFSGPTRRAARLETHYRLGGEQAAELQDNSPVASGAESTLFDDLFDEGRAS
ncbi:CRISPR-associated protein Cas5 [Mycolicibacterium senegalense]|uniref:CRISPR-associated protein Cas5 n=1 Tax=Mycolicibacterium senegalense TaxID=1796 RepID=UPI003AABC52F